MRLNGMRIAVLGGITAVCCSGAAFGQNCTSGSGMKGGGSYSSQDKMFLKNSAEGSMAEVKLAQIALSKSSNDEVKGFAQKMVDDHTKLISDMQPFAQKAGVTPPTKLKPEHQMLAKKLSGLSGDAFDKQYITEMVKDHHKDLAEFKSEESSTSNTDLKNAVSQGEQVIQQHTEMIDEMAKKNGISAPTSAM